MTEAAPGSAEGVQLVVDDIVAARAELPATASRSARCSTTPAGLPSRRDRRRVAGLRLEQQTYASLVSFADPDGNSLVVQEVTTRRPGRSSTSLPVLDSVAGLEDALRRAEAAHGKYEGEIGNATRTGRPGTPVHGGRGGRPDEGGRGRGANERL